MKCLFYVIIFFVTTQVHAEFIIPNQTTNNRDEVKNPIGYKLISIEKGSIYEKLGLKQGDTIKSINGKSVKTPQDAMELTNLMKTAEKIEIDLVRNGSTLKMIYQIK